MLDTDWLSGCDHVLTLYSPFLNIAFAEQAIIALKTAMKAEISQPAGEQRVNNREEARRQGIPLGGYRREIV